MNTKSSTTQDVASGADKAATENLRFAVSDHQEMIRGADLKAEVLGIFLTAVFAAIAWEGRLSTTALTGWLEILAAFAALIAFCSIGGVLWPRSDPWHEVSLGGYTPTRALYPPPMHAEPGYSVREHASRSVNTNWPIELT